MNSQKATDASDATIRSMSTNEDSSRSSETVMMTSQQAANHRTTTDGSTYHDNGEDVEMNTRAAIDANVAMGRNSSDASDGRAQKVADDSNGAARENASGTVARSNNNIGVQEAACTPR